MSNATTSPATGFPKPKPVVRLTETALLLALGVVLSLLPLLKLPFGGTVTVASGVPVLLIAYRYGARWGLLTGFAFSLLRLLIELEPLSWATSFIAAMAILFLDYLFAFTALSAGAWFRNRTPSQSAALGLGALCACLLRFLCHVISGCTVWAGISIPTRAALLYSLSYNATYMIPETLVTVLAAVYLGQALDLRSERFTRLSARPNTGFGLKVLAGLILSAVCVFDIIKIFAPLQDAESGEFSLAGLSAVPWTLLGIVTAAGAAAALILWLFARHKSYKQTT